MPHTSQQLISQLQLKLHPEGGYYKEVFKSRYAVKINTKTRSASTSIYYLLEKNDFSAGYRITAVAPGFEFEDFELADRKVLMQKCPVHEEIIYKLTR